MLGGTTTSTRKAAECGLSVVNVEKAGLFEPDARGYCAQTHLIDYQDIPLVTALARTLHGLAPFARVISHTEAGPLVAGHLTTVLGLPGNGTRVTRLLHDKLSLRAALNAAGIGPVKAEPGTSREALMDFVARNGAAVVKPTMGSGSLGVRKIRSVAEAAESWEWLTSFGLRQFMVEELLDGTEISVETFSDAGRHTVLAVTGKDIGDGVVELGHVVPAALSEHQTAEVVAFTQDVLNAIGLVEGASHTEIILTPSGPRVVESHNRCGGDHIVDLVEMVCGVDLERLTYQLALPAGVAPFTTTDEGAAAIRYLTPPAGRIESVIGIDQARDAEGVVKAEVTVEPGQTVRPLLWSEDRCGLVIARAEHSAEAVERARRAADLIRIHTTPAAPPPVTTMGDLLSKADEVLDPFITEAATSTR
ncbi:ATP-grasp domain-containing protein [Micromonospora peucetia]|uniref:ATP-grasp domain-containing protein n=1 Tax=Micromonospora peucetia TaxID=47871 RepID=A0ABZ1EE77_9ACTN|nr:ATP-grasp domain-containing protein [Micromonospora peucetia]WSA33145.1 ATP-grasp domain-containing protein [Micromonospora peucetia]